MNGEGEADLMTPLLGKFFQDRKRDGHEHIVMESHRRKMRISRLGVLNLAQDVVNRGEP